MMYMYMINNDMANVLKLCTTLWSDKMACKNSADPDQTAPEQSDQGLCLC